MEQLTAWKSCDGQIFETEDACLRHEQVITASVLDAFVLGFDSEGKKVSWADTDGAYACYALLLSYPSDEVLADPIFDKAWADYLDTDLEWQLRYHRACGWYVRDPHDELWYRWTEYEKDFNNIRNTLSQLGEKHGG